MTYKHNLPMQSAPLSKTSKMPWYSWNIDSKHCKTAHKQVKELDSPICGDCYASKGRYCGPRVIKSEEENYLVWKTMKHESWVREYINLISDRVYFTRSPINSHFFRIFDSGDLQSVEMLRAWTEVATDLPSVRFWLPTREVDFVNSYIMKGGIIPKNLKIRISDGEFDQIESEHQDWIDEMNKMPNVKCEIGSSGVKSKKSKLVVLNECISSKQDGKCFGSLKKCADCWLSVHDRIYYNQH